MKIKILVKFIVFIIISQIYSTVKESKKRTSVGRQKFVFIWLRRWDLLLMIKCSVRFSFGLFAIRRSDTTNYAMFDPDFCGVWSFMCCCAFHSAFFTDCDFSSPQNRFIGPKAVRLKPHTQTQKERTQSTQMGKLSSFGCGGGI